jgi:hypothetical protein
VFEVCHSGKTFYRAGLWIEPDGKVGGEAEIGQYGGWSEKNEGAVLDTLILING